MLLASGANFGFRRSVPHMLGIGLGFVFLILMVGAGLVRVFDEVPYSYAVLKIAAVVYLLWLAWKIAGAAPARNRDSKTHPLTFLQAASFQWINPKGWAMALTAVTVYTPADTFQAVAVVAAVFGVINLPSVSLWALLGQQMARLLTNPARLQVFNMTMAALLIVSLYPLVIS